MQFSIKLILDQKLHSQNKGHWRAKAALVKQARNSAAAQAKLQRVKLSGLVTVDYHFRVPDRRRRDLANMIHSCKPFVDGVVDSGAISGDHWEVLGIGAVTCEVVRTLVTCEVVLTFEGNS